MATGMSEGAVSAMLFFLLSGCVGRRFCTLSGGAPPRHSHPMHDVDFTAGFGASRSPVPGSFPAASACLLWRVSRARGVGLQVVEMAPRLPAGLAARVDLLGLLEGPARRPP